MDYLASRSQIYNSGSGDILNNIADSIDILRQTNKIKYLLFRYRKGIEELKREVDVSDALANQFSDIFEKWENSIDASDSWFETSLAGHLEYWECEGNILTVWKGNGYKTLFDLLEVSFGCNSNNRPFMHCILLASPIFFRLSLSYL